MLEIEEEIEEHVLAEVPGTEKKDTDNKRKQFYAFLLTVWRGEEFREKVESTFQKLLDEREIHAATWQLEKCPKSGRPHWQIYVSTKKNRRFGWLSGELGVPHGGERGAGGCWEKGVMRFPNLDANWDETHERLKNYCSKERSRLAEGKSIGEYPKQSATKYGSDEKNLDSFALDHVNNKRSWAESFQNAPGFVLRYHKHIQEVERLILPPPVRREKVVVLFQGAAGIGKTSWIKWTYGPENCFTPICSLNTKAWYDGYKGEEVIILEEFEGQWPITELNKLFDRDPARVEFKGGSVVCRAHTFFITSNKGPTEWWPDNCWNAEQMRGLQRRITYRFLNEIPEKLEPFPIFPPDELPPAQQPKVLTLDDVKKLKRAFPDAQPKELPKFMKKDVPAQGL